MKLTDIFRKVEMISPDDAKQMLSDSKNEVMLVDVREPREYEQGHLPGAFLMPMSGLMDKIGDLDPAKPVITY
jgi:rhodanese-related sulfurtransferase